jgi:hypothetical protein
MWDPHPKITGRVGLVLTKVLQLCLKDWHTDMPPIHTQTSIFLCLFDTWKHHYVGEGLNLSCLFVFPIRFVRFQLGCFLYLCKINFIRVYQVLSIPIKTIIIFNNWSERFNYIENLLGYFVIYPVTFTINIIQSWIDMILKSAICTINNMNKCKMMPLGS